MCCRIVSLICFRTHFSLGYGGYKCLLCFIALKIHLSRATFELLSKEKQKWHMVERGEMEMKVLQ